MYSLHIYVDRNILLYVYIYIWSNYSDLTRPISPKWWFSKGNSRTFQGNRLVGEILWTIWPDYIRWSHMLGPPPPPWFTVGQPSIHFYEGANTNLPRYTFGIFFHRPRDLEAFINFMGSGSFFSDSGRMTPTHPKDTLIRRSNGPGMVLKKTLVNNKRIQ